MTADDRAVPFNNIYLTDQAHSNIFQSLESGALSGDGGFTRRCHQWLETYHKSPKALLTHSCTAALEMCALLLDIQPGDEVIMPSYIFVSTANAYVLRGAVPVFVDIRADTLNIDETLIEDAINPKTKAIVAVHYAGVACEMNRITAIAATHGLHVIEDAAQGMMATYKRRALGSMGHLGALSFHATKISSLAKAAHSSLMSKNMHSEQRLFGKKALIAHSFCAEKSSNILGKMPDLPICLPKLCLPFYGRNWKTRDKSPTPVLRFGIDITT